MSEETKTFEAKVTKIGDEIAAKPVAEWTTEEIKRRERPTHRCMLEVY